MISDEEQRYVDDQMQAVKAEFEKQILVHKSELNLYQKRCEQYEQAYEQMRHQLQELLRHRFGKKSERFIDDTDPFQQRSLFELPSAPSVESNEGDENNEEDKKIIITYERKGTSKKSHQDLPRRIEIIPVSDADKRCVCGCIKKVIRYDVKELLHYVSAVFEIIEQRREVVACANGCEKQIITAPLPLHVLPKAKVSEAFLAFLIVSKMDDRQPLYHLEQQLWQRYGIDCSRQTMARWLIDLMPNLQPIYNLMKDEVLNYDVASCDATTLQVLKEPGRKAETKSYVYCIRGGSPDKNVVLYDYNDKLHKQFVKDWFADYKGYLHVDGDNFFDLVGEEKEIHLVHCNAHARRKFEPIAESTKGRGVAKEALRFYKALYKIERRAKEEKLAPKERYELRQKESKPLMVTFKKWLDEIWPTVLPQSSLGKAIKYCFNLWPGLTRYLDDGRLDIDNNLTEQEIKPFVISRKNFLFAASVDGAKALCMHFSFVRTAKRHGLDPYKYYADLLKNIPHCQRVEDYEKLLPWNINSIMTNSE